jgi:hypothetical protein
MDALKPPASTANIRKNCAASPQGKIVLRGIKIMVGELVKGTGSRDEYFKFFNIKSVPSVLYMR